MFLETKFSILLLKTKVCCYSGIKLLSIKMLFVFIFELFNGRESFVLCDCFGLYLAVSQ